MPHTQTLLYEPCVRWASGLAVGVGFIAPLARFLFDFRWEGALGLAKNCTGLRGLVGPYYYFLITRCILVPAEVDPD